ncbi:DNA-binding response regulator [Dokdonia sinensis]|uniref:DNA-binding response regulator n=1 Tax=Dokdonia sinensis TaxID=2479847 RepID=A0A3M0G6T1_9FLAO|nr:response regulator transcription factor [Dokdonia sinensis]RMB58042.1 DNA-binding response regulator [Dokdonia sinensis]
MFNKSQISIVVADDHPIMRKGLSQELQEAGYDLVAIAENGALALEAIVNHKPTIALLDIEMPLLTGFEVIKRSRKESPVTKFIAMTYHKEKGFVVQAKNLKVDGYMLKEDGIDEIERCIEAVLNNKTYYSKSFDAGFEKIVQDELKKITLLTPSERTIIRLVAQQKTSTEIGELLLISPRTVQKHRTNIIAKLDLASGTDALSQWVLEHKELVNTL